MGRSRMVSRPEDEDSNQSKSKRKRPSSTEATNPATGQESGDGKAALYHCNYCNKDLSGRIRIKCVACPDFDLCVECFSVGAELRPHKSNHPYRVMHNTCPNHPRKTAFLSKGRMEEELRDCPTNGSLANQAKVKFLQKRALHGLNILTISKKMIKVFLRLPTKDTT
ncbi:transcriptional adapter ADA2-like isoform X2 [Cucumis melo var. makuwa]|uniref:Transcriptional adapter ADA2-like isoform X2 n=1 Tax=Cucumis melo var. makuwa TaxID=1194695 RepID=A0A5D3DHD5_CUCMM|nr:transcriptional adapter ADA2-like isoform X2 [Cucumis melo var. makuwa]